MKLASFAPSIVPSIALSATLLLVPSLGLAMGGCQGQEHQTQSCAPGTVWDAQQQACIKQATS